MAGLDRPSLRERLTAARAGFHALLDGLGDDDLRRPSGNPAWTVGAVLATLEGLRDDELELGARFWSEGFRDIAGLYAAQHDHVVEHAVDIPRLAAAAARDNAQADA